MPLGPTMLSSPIHWHLDRVIPARDSATIAGHSLARLVRRRLADRAVDCFELMDMNFPDYSENRPGQSVIILKGVHPTVIFKIRALFTMIPSHPALMTGLLKSECATKQRVTDSLCFGTSTDRPTRAICIAQVYNRMPLRGESREHGHWAFILTISLSRLVFTRKRPQEVVPLYLSAEFALGSVCLYPGQMLATETRPCIS